jgi:hypothetical protein
MERPAGPAAHGIRKKVFASFFRKKFFFEKKNQKTFASLEALRQVGGVMRRGQA